MPELKDGIRLNQAAPRLNRANRRPLYIVSGAVIVVFALLIWAWVVRLNMKAEARLRAAAVTQAQPATNALRDLNKRWDVKPPPLSQTRQAIPSTPTAALSAQPIQSPALQSSGAQVQPVSYQLRQPSLKEQLEAEELQAMDSPLTPSQAGATSPAPSAAALPDWTGPRAPADNKTPGENIEINNNDYLRQNLQSSKKGFAGLDKDTTVPIFAASGEQPKYMVKAGWDIPAILEQQANSDLPGELRARVRENVYDTETGRYLLIPQNSILVGRYNSDIAYAQNRIQVNWDRLERPGEPTIYLNHMNGLAADGSSGLTGTVDNHWKRLIGFALLSSAFAAGIELSQNRNTSVYAYPSDAQLAGQAVGQQLGQFGQRIADRNLNRPPTIAVPAGTIFNIRVDRDIVFTDPYVISNAASTQPFSRHRSEVEVQVKNERAPGP